MLCWFAFFGGGKIFAEKGEGAREGAYLEWTRIEGPLEREKAGEVISMGLLSPWLASERLKRVSKWVTGDAVLDVGCADGRVLGYLTKPEDLRYVGIDAGGTEIATAKTRFPGREFYAVFVTENSVLPFRGGFDSIIMAAFIEHVDNPSKVLTRLKRELNPGGRVIITTPTRAAEPVLRFGSRLGIFSKEAFNEHKSYFGKEELVKVLADAGLRVEHYERFQFGFNQLAVARARGSIIEERQSK